MVGQLIINSPIFFNNLLKTFWHYLQNMFSTSLTVDFFRFFLYREVLKFSVY